MDPFFRNRSMPDGHGFPQQRTMPHRETSKQRPEGPENENRGRKLREVAVLKISTKIFEMCGMNHDFPIYQTAVQHVEQAFLNKPYMDQWPVQQAGKATKAERRESQRAVLEIAGIMRQFAETLTSHLDVVSTLLVKLHGALAMVTARFYRKHKANDAVMVKSIFVDVTFNTFIVNTWRIDLTVLRTRFGSFDWANNFDAYRLSKDCREWENPLSLVVNHIELQSLQDRISSVTMQNQHLTNENQQLKAEIQALRNQLHQVRGTTPPSVSQGFHFVPQSHSGSQPTTPQGDAKAMFDFHSIPPTIKQDTSVSAPNSLLAWQHMNGMETTFNINGFNPISNSSANDSHLHGSSSLESNGFPSGMTTQIVLGNNGHALGHIGVSQPHGSVSAPMVRAMTPSSSTSPRNTPPHSNPNPMLMPTMPNNLMANVLFQQQQQQQQRESQMQHFQDGRQYGIQSGRMLATVADNNLTRRSEELSRTTPYEQVSRPVPQLNMNQQFSFGGGMGGPVHIMQMSPSHSVSSIDDPATQLAAAQAKLQAQLQQNQHSMGIQQNAMFQDFPFESFGSGGYDDDVDMR